MHKIDRANSVILREAKDLCNLLATTLSSHPQQEHVPNFPARPAQATPIPEPGPLANPSMHLSARYAARHYLLSSPKIVHPRGDVEKLHCLRCHQELEAGHKSVAVYMFAQTVGIRPRQKSAAQRICFCPQCSVSLAMGPAPEGALNLAAWQMIRDLVSSDPALNQAAWESLRGITGLLPATGTDGGGTRPANPGGYFEF